MAIEEGVEGMKEFFLRPLLAAEKLNVVDQKNVGLTITLAEFDEVTVLDRIDELINEKFARKINDLRVFFLRHSILADGLHQVRLAESDTAVNKEWVVSSGRRLRHRQTGGVGDLVVRTDYKTFEVVTRVESENASRRFGLAPRFMDLLRRSVLVFCQKTRNAGREREFNLPRFAQGRDNRSL